MNRDKKNLDDLLREEKMSGFTSNLLSQGYKNWHEELEKLSFPRVDQDPEANKNYTTRIVNNHNEKSLLLLKSVKK